VNPFEAATAFWSALLPKAVVPETDEMARMGQSMTALFTSATAMMGQLASQMPGSDANMQAVFRKIADPAAWLSGGSDLHHALDQMSHGPRFADLWDVERRFARLSAAMLEMRRSTDAHHVVVMGAWMQAASEFSEALTAKPVTDSRAMTALWSEIANRVLIAAQRSEAFLASQTATLRASAELSLAQQELGEYFGRYFGFPTRTELDDVHRSLTELRRELRGLRRDLPQKVSA
jgi:hypothetical protein